MTDFDEFTVSIRLGDTIEIPVIFKPCDTVEDVAYQFCKHHKLSITFYDKIAQFLRDKLKDEKNKSRPSISEISNTKDSNLHNHATIDSGIREYHIHDDTPHATIDCHRREQACHTIADHRPRLFQAVAKQRPVCVDVNERVCGGYGMDGLCRSINESLDRKLRKIAADGGGVEVKRGERITDGELFRSGYRGSQARPYKGQENSFRKVLNHRSIEDNQKGYISINEQVKRQMNFSGKNSGNHSKRVNSCLDTHKNISSKGFNQSLNLRNHNRSMIYNLPQKINEFYTVNTIIDSPTKPHHPRRKPAYETQRSNMNTSTNKISAHSKKTSVRHKTNNSSDINRFDQLYAMSKVFAERAMAKQQLQDHQYPFKPSITHHRSHKTAMSFDERLNIDFSSRREKSKKRQDETSRDTLRQSMTPNTGRHPIVREVVYRINREKQRCI